MGNSKAWLKKLTVILTVSSYFGVGSPFALQNSVCASSTYTTQDEAKATFSKIWKKVSDQQGYSGSPLIEEKGKMYIPCVNGNKVKLTLNELKMLQTMFKKPLEMLLLNPTHYLSDSSSDKQASHIVQYVPSPVVVQSAPIVPVAYVPVTYTYSSESLESILNGPIPGKYSSLLTVGDLLNYIKNKGNDLKAGIKELNSKKLKFYKGALKNIVGTTRYDTLSRSLGNDFNFYVYAWGETVESLEDNYYELQNVSENLAKLNPKLSISYTNGYGQKADVPNYKWKYSDNGLGDGFLGRWGYSVIESLNQKLLSSLRF